jgi:hypothetical protein
MKKCSYCGRENPDEATQCSGCGTQEFKVEISPTIPPQEKSKMQNSPSFKVPFLLRVSIAISVWFIVSGISLYVAWQQANHSIAWEEQWVTRHELENMGKAIIAFREKFNSNPTNFGQLQGMTNEVPEMGLWFPEGFTDGWQHPFIFSNEGTNCLIISHGGDGKSGGKGIDCDLTSDNPRPKESSPTFAQFFDNKECKGMIDWSFICGGLAALLSLLTVRVPNLTRRGLIILALSLCATLIGTFFVTTIITALHIPSGH